jgi:hypothetical protein
MESQFDIFLSYDSDDKPYAGELADKLEATGVRATAVL